MAREERDYNRPALRRPAKPKAAAVKGHEAFLKQLETSGTEIELEKMNGKIVVGKVKCSDKFTITVKDSSSGRDRVMFKHDVSEFCALGARSKFEDRDE